MYFFELFQFLIIIPLLKLDLQNFIDFTKLLQNHQLYYIFQMMIIANYKNQKSLFKIVL